MVWRVQAERLDPSFGDLVDGVTFVAASMEIDLLVGRSTSGRVENVPFPVLSLVAWSCCILKEHR